MMKKQLRLKSEKCMKIDIFEFDVKKNYKNDEKRQKICSNQKEKSPWKMTFLSLMKNQNDKYDEDNEK